MNNFESITLAKLDLSPEAQPPNLNCCLANKKDKLKKGDDTTKHPSDSKELFVFGKAQGDSVFKFSKLLGGVGSTVKRLFGFKS